MKFSKSLLYTVLVGSLLNVTSQSSAQEKRDFLRAMNVYNMNVYKSPEVQQSLPYKLWGAWCSEKDLSAGMSLIIFGHFALEAYEADKLNMTQFSDIYIICEEQIDTMRREAEKRGIVINVPQAFVLLVSQNMFVIGEEYLDDIREVPSLYNKYVDFYNEVISYAQAHIQAQ